MAITEAQREVLPRDVIVLMEMREAEARGDQAEFYRLIRELNVPAETLMAIKNHEPLGAKFIRELRLKTDLADAKYGPGWMDREGWA